MNFSAKKSDESGVILPKPFYPLGFIIRSVCLSVCLCEQMSLLVLHVLVLYNVIPFVQACVRDMRTWSYHNELAALLYLYLTVSGGSGSKCASHQTYAGSFACVAPP